MNLKGSSFFLSSLSGFGKLDSKLYLTVVYYSEGEEKRGYLFFVVVVISFWNLVINL